MTPRSPHPPQTLSSLARGAASTALAALVLVALLSAAPTGAAEPPGIDPDLLAGLAARSIGPATMSGRVAAVTTAPGDPDRVWVGAATGGVWRSQDGGLTWEPVFDDQPVASIGAVAVSPANPDRVWVGTGEGNPRNSTSVGNGVYRSDDGGESWRHLGLEESERIHRVVLHPTDPDTAWVCAMGRTWGESEQRGVYRTRDGGESWQRVLGGSSTTGCADLEPAPDNPSKLYAALWDHRRWPWFFRSGGPGSGLHVTRDGGDTWEEVTAADGLPEGELGRIGLAAAPSDASTVYAFVEAETNGLYRSTDGGRTWELRTTDVDAGNRPFYYADLRVDPADPDRVYSLWSMVSVSDDGGESFDVLVPFRAAHPDHHAMWIDPDDPTHLLVGNDGGVYESRDHGGSWRFVSNLPLAQVYHLRVDELEPYHVYFGLQDNGSWRGPAEVWENGGIRNHHWQEVGFGDGFDTAPVAGDERRGYAMSQQGYLVRWDLDTGERKAIRPGPPEDGEELRFSWNAAFAPDPFDPDALWFGSQFVHRSEDRGETWEVVSPDLTTDREEWQRQDESGGLTLDVTGAENFTTLTSLAPSPLEPGVVWAGSDDGRLHVTRDGGESWTSVEERIPGVPAHTWIPHVEASPHHAGTAFVVFDDHRRSSWTPYLYRTTDFGDTWTRLAGPDDVRGYALSVVQDPVDPDLLFLGTELGLWATLDGGASWLPWDHGVPTVAVRDLAIQRREADLVVGTHGRSVFVVDDLSPLRHLDPAALDAPLHLFPVTEARQHRVAQTGSSRFPGSGEFRGDNEPYGALITFSVAGDDLPHPDPEVERRRREAEALERRGQGKENERPLAREEGSAAAARAASEGTEATGEEPAGEEEEPTPPKAEIEVRDAAGEVIRTFDAEVHRGINRTAWDLRRDAFAEPDRGDLPRWWEPSGPEVVPGTYTVTVRFRGAEASAPVRVLADPRFRIAAEDRLAKRDALLRLGTLQEALTEAIERVRGARADVAAVLERAGDPDDDSGGNGGGSAGGDEAMAEDETTEGGSGEAAPSDLRSAARELTATLDALERRLWTPPEVQDIPPDTDAWSKVSRAQRQLGGDWAAPTAAQQRYAETAETAVATAVEAVNRAFAEEVAPFRRLVREAGVELLPEEEPLTVP